jgi:hypothetical protein
MSTAGHTPNFIAEEAIYPFRCVKVGTLPFKAVPSTANPEILLGVTDGSIQTFNGTYHATAGQTISLQNGEFVQLTASGSITVGDTLIATTDGKVEASVSATEYVAQAAENANDGEIFWAKKIGAWTVSGGGPSPIGGGWPAPESKALWSCEFTGAIPVFDATPVDPAFLPGPDFYFQRSDAGQAAVEQNYFPVARHFGVVDVSVIGNAFDPQWIMVGNAPPITPADFNASSIGGRPGVDLRYDNNEFVVIWKPYSYLNTGSGLDWRVYAGCLSASLSYPDHPIDGGVGFFFRASPANANWICVARFYNATTSSFIEYTQDSGVPINIVSPAWKNMKVITVEGSTPGSYPTVEWYIDGTLIHSLDVNTIASNIRSSLDAEPIFAMAGAYVVNDEDVSQVLANQLDYMHALTTFTNPR